MSTTTVRLSEDLKARVAKAAERAGTTAHNFIIEAIAEKAEELEQRSAFQSEAEARYDTIVESGKTIGWSRKLPQPVDTQYWKMWPRREDEVGMKKSKFSESQIVAILKEGEAGVAVAEVCRKHGISSATWYLWKSKYAGATVSDLTRMRELQAENARLKRMYADLALENAAMKDVISKKF
jgi:putative transposase